MFFGSWSFWNLGLWEALFGKFVGSFLSLCFCIGYSLLLGYAAALLLISRKGSRSSSGMRAYSAYSLKVILQRFSVLLK